MKFIKRLFCTHHYRLIRTIHGDEAQHARSEWRCVKCDKCRYSKHLSKLSD